MYGGDKGKAVTFVDVPDMENIEDWRRFKEIGLLDEAAIERRDRQALLQNIAKLETELFDYQHNMGLLLIENKEWTSKYDELRGKLAELVESLKREQSAHLISIAEVERREQHLRNAVTSEKKCVTDLEKALLQAHAEHEQIKLAAETRLADSSALVTGYHDKSMEVQGKLHAADAMLAEANRKNSELERKLGALEVRESVLRRERASLTAEQEVHEANYLKYKDDFREWEMKLQETEEKLCEERRNLGEREEKANYLDMAHKQKRKRLEEEQKRIDSACIALNKRDEDTSKKVALMIKKEKNLESYRAEMETKEKELNFLAEKLDTREREEIQKLLDEHRAAFNAQQQELELDLSRRRNLFNEELRVKFDAIKQRDMEVNLLEEKLRERDQALENKLERFKEREKEIEGKSKAIKGSEKSLKAEEKRLELVKKGTLSEIQGELNLKHELDVMKAEISQKELNIAEAIEKLEVSKAERAEHLELQMQLKRESEKYKFHRELILKEDEALKQDRLKFEKQWEALDEKRVGVTKELQQLQAEKAVLDDLRHTQDEQLSKNKLAVVDYIKQELEALKSEKESFSANMKYEQLLLSEKAANDHNTFVCDFVARKRDREAILQSKEEEMDKSFERELKSLNDKREIALGDVISLKESIKKEIEEVRSEKVRLENKKQEIEFNKNHHQFELRKDIHFLAFLKKIKGCENCGEIAREYSVSNSALGKISGYENSPLSKEKVAFYGENFERSPAEAEQSDPNSSWFRKCTTKLFSSSPNRKTLAMDSSKPCEIFSAEIRDRVIAEGGPSVQYLPPDNSVTVDYHSDMDSRIQSEESKQSELRSGRKRSGKGILRTRTVKAVVEEAAIFLGKNAEAVEEHAKEDTTESRGRSASTVPRKRTRSQTTATHIDANDSEGHSESVTTGGHRKRHQPSTSTGLGEKRYNLRRHQQVAVSFIETNSVGQRGEKRDVDQAASKDEVASSRAVEIGNASSSRASLVHDALLRSTENENLTLERVVRFKTLQDDDVDAAKLMEKRDPREEVNDTLPYCSEYEHKEHILEDDDNNSYEDDENSEFQQPGEVSIGKKVWQFFTS